MLVKQRHEEISRPRSEIEKVDEFLQQKIDNYLQKRTIFGF